MTTYGEPPKPGLGGNHHKRRDPDKVRKHAFRRSPCGRPPVEPEGLIGEFDRAEAGKHNRIRCKVRWNEVVLDSSGFPILLRNYIVELEYTANGSDWFQARRATVSAKADDDPNNKAHHIFKSVQKNLAYRFRVRAVARDGCKSNWSNWEVIGNPGEDEPPAPQDVTIVDNDKHMRVHVRWEATPNVDDPDDLFDDRIHHFVVQISKSPTFGTTYRRVRNKGGNQVTVRINDADENDTFYARVRSVGPDKDKSAWIPATLNGNSDPGANPDGVSVGKAMEKTKKPKVPTGVSVTFASDDDNTRGRRWKAKVQWNEVTQDINNKDIDLGHYVVQFQKSDNGTTWTTEPRKFVVNAKDEDADTTNYKTIHTIHGKKFYRARVRAVSESHTRGDFSSWTGDSNGPGSLTVPTPINVTIRHKTRGRDRVVLDWDAPVDPNDADLPDERVDYFQVVIKRNSSVTPTTLASGYRFDRKVVQTAKTFTILRAHEDDDFYGWVRTIDDSGNKSAWIPGTRAGNSSAGASAELINTDDNVPVGSVRKYAGPSSDIGTGKLRDYLFCNGQSVSTATFPDLFAVIDYNYGGSGSTFNVPDHRKRQARGVGTSQTLGDTEGLAEGSRDEDHGKHNKGRHKKHKKHWHRHHHRRKRGKHNGNVGHAHEHQHKLGPPGFLNTTGANLGPAVGGSGTPTDLTRIAHTHSFPVGAATKFAKVAPAGDETDGDVIFSQPSGADTNEDASTAEGHKDTHTLPDGASSLFTDSQGGGTISGSHDSVTDRNRTWDGSPTDGVPTGAVNFITIDDEDANLSDLGAGNAGHNDHALPDDDDGVRGHKKHPYIRFHYMIKAR